MALRSRTRLQLRRTVVAAALGALFVPAAADAKTKTPVVSKITPKIASVGTKITITGRNFRRGKAKNSVLFRRDNGKALFVKADVSTTKKLTVVVPKTLEKYMLTKGSVLQPTRFRVRVLAFKLSKAYTAAKLSPVISPEKLSTDGNSDGAGVPTSPDGDCDADGVKNGIDTDDDNDLLADTLELTLMLDPCSGDTDGDDVEDGFEYMSARDLNDDDYQSPNIAIPYPHKTPYPNPLFKDAGRDYDGDGLALSDEYKLWKYTYEVNHTGTRTLFPLTYSDGLQYSITARADEYLPPVAFRGWADANGFGQVFLPSIGATRDLFDMDRDGVVTTVARAAAPSTGEQLASELRYWNLDNGVYVSDDERDEDADGLNNYHETTGWMTPQFWEQCYADEGAYPIPYVGTKAYDADSDGDGILDGADDQDFDDVPNVMELSRNMAGNVAINGVCGGDATYDSTAPPLTYVNPFNPCLPNRNSRTCQRHPAIGAGYAPFLTPFEPKIRN